VSEAVASVAGLVTWRYVYLDEERQGDTKLDVLGVLSLTIGLFALLLALDQSSTDGWTDPTIASLFAVAIVALLGFVAEDRRAGEGGLIPPDVVASRDFASAAIAVLLMSAIFFATLLYLPQFMVKELGYSALGSGVGLLPMMGTFAIMSFVAGGPHGRMGPKIAVSTGATLPALGMALLAITVGSSSAYASLAAGMVVLGAGIGLFYSSVTTAAVTALDRDRAGLAGGIIYMCQIADGSVGLGLNTALVESKGSLPAGMQLAFGVDAVLAALGLGVSLLFVGGSRDPLHVEHLTWRHRAHA
jgi:hypothetical protein